MKKKSKQKTITLREYQEKLDAIIDKGQEVSATLIELLEEAAKYKIGDK